MEVLPTKYNLNLSRKETIALIKSYYTNIHSIHRPRIALSLFTKIALDIEKLLTITGSRSHEAFLMYTSSLDEVFKELGDPIDLIFDCLFKKVLISYLDENGKEITRSVILKEFVDDFEPLTSDNSNIGNIGFEFFSRGKFYKVSYLFLLEITLLDASEN